MTEIDRENAINFQTLIAALGTFTWRVSTATAALNDDQRGLLLMAAQGIRKAVIAYAHTPRPRPKPAPRRAPRKK